MRYFLFVCILTNRKSRYYKEYLLDVVFKPISDLP